MFVRFAFHFLLITLLTIVSTSGKLAAAEELLPMGSAPAPEMVPHFPDRLHTFVWRNWNLVPLSRLAEVLRTEPENVTKLAESMGLPEYREPAWSTEKIYITLIRRNWHLLPYEQILELTEMTPQRLAFALREDDFLWVKLGLLKPKCEPLYYSPPDENAMARAAEIRNILQEYLGNDTTNTNEEPRFAFIDKLTKTSGRDLKTASDSASAEKSLKYIYSYFALYGDPLLGDPGEVFPDGLLEKLGEIGVNGVWLHVVLREMATGGEKFPEFGHDCEKRLANLRILVARAKKYGINIYLYMNEPRAMPKAFFQRQDVPGRAETAGVDDGDYSTLCISNPDVQNWIRDALAHVFAEVPGLGGVFTISGSENHTHCNSHGRWQTCPHCKTKTGAEITALANTLVEQGVHRSAPDAKVIVWDWGWNDSQTPEIIERLPSQVWLQSVSEWSLPIERGGVSSAVGEYSISSIGPGPRATKHWKLAKERGLKTVAKVQLNCTWEIAAVPYVPVMDLIAEHCSRLAQSDIDGMMLSWTLGGYPSPNLEIPKRFDRTPLPEKETVLDELAQERYGINGAPLARRAWTKMSNAYREYPYSGGVVYCAPVQMGPANLMRPLPTGFRATMVGIPYDDIDSWRGGLYPPEIFAQQFEKIASGFSDGITELEKAVELAPEAKKPEVQAELRYAKAVWHHFGSVANQVRYILLRNEYNDSQTTSERKKELAERIVELLRREIELTRKHYRLTLQDSSIGFESSNQYFYVPNDLLEKLISCRDLIDKYQITNVSGGF